MLNEGKKKTLTSGPLPLNSKKKKKEKNQGAPFQHRTMNRI
jgi:hypothetical protein